MSLLKIPPAKEFVLNLLALILFVLGFLWGYTNVFGGAVVVLTTGITAPIAAQKMQLSKAKYYFRSTMMIAAYIIMSMFWHIPYFKNLTST